MEGWEKRKKKGRKEKPGCPIKQSFFPLANLLSLLPSHLLGSSVRHIKRRITEGKAREEKEEKDRARPIRMAGGGAEGSCLALRKSHPNLFFSALMHITPTIVW